MREIIEQLMEVEAEAQRIVHAAQAEADHIVSAAQRQAQELSVRGREDARVAADALLTTAMAEADRDKQAHLEEARQKIDGEIRLDEEAAGQIVTEIVRCITRGH